MHNPTNHIFWQVTICSILSVRLVFIQDAQKVVKLRSWWLRKMQDLTWIQIWCLHPLIGDVLRSQSLIMLEISWDFVLLTTKLTSAGQAGNSIYRFSWSANTWRGSHLFSGKVTVSCRRTVKSKVTAMMHHRRKWWLSTMSQNKVSILLCSPTAHTIFSLN